jgi:pimeloyl-ACP methyl ester carboxylesterase
VLDSGAGNTHRQWRTIQRAVAAKTEVCSWDRPGTGRSPAPHRTVAADGVVARLHALLRAAHVRPPYVLAGHSLGGFLALLYTHRHPREVRGLVLVDATAPSVVVPFALGVLADGTHAVDLRAEAQELEGVGAAPADSLVLVRGRETFPSESERLWQRAQASLASGPRSLLVTARRSGHGIPEEQPALVVAALEEEVAAARGARGPRCTVVLARAGGACHV